MHGKDDKIIKFNIFSKLMKLSGKQVSHTDLKAMPAFVRFDTIMIDYYPGNKFITKKCKWIKSVLLPLKHCMDGANLEFYCDINAIYASDFYDHSILLAHIENELLPICSACRSFKFVINFYSDYSSATKIIAKILQFGPIDGCRNVSFDLYFDESEPVNLPIDLLAKWLNLNQSCKAINSNLLMKKERVLEICTNNGIPNISEMLNCLKTVNLFN